jgi:dienelactone hydrolase
LVSLPEKWPRPVTSPCVTTRAAPAKWGTENRHLAEYADDVLAVVQWLRKRPDVDADRIAVVGYGDGGPVAMLAASREKRVKAVALVASPGRSGREVTLEQQQQVLAGLTISESEKAARRTLQSRVNEATMTRRGWEGIPSDLRRQAETWFRSWLSFDPRSPSRR